MRRRTKNTCSDKSARCELGRWPDMVNMARWQPKSQPLAINGQSCELIRPQCLLLTRRHVQLVKLGVSPPV